MQDPKAEMRRAWTGTSEEKPCAHKGQVQDVGPNSMGCDECVALGDTWPDIRFCATCGYVGCCDGAKNKHMLKHHQETGHAIIKPLESDIEWMWCYVDEALL